MSRIEPTFEDKAYDKGIGNSMNGYSTSMRIHENIVIYQITHKR